MNEASQGLSTSSWSRTTGPMFLVSFAGGEYLYLYQIEFTLGVHVYLLAKVKLDHPSSMGAQVWDDVSGQQRVHTCIWGTPECGLPMGWVHVCSFACVCVPLCVSRWDTRTNRKATAVSLSLGRDPGFPDTEQRSKSCAGAAGGHHLTLHV